MEQTPFSSKKNAEFVGRLLKDALSPHSIGPETPTILMNYVMRHAVRGTRGYVDADVPLVWAIWTLWVLDRDTQIYQLEWDRRSGLGKLHSREETVNV